MDEGEQQKGNEGRKYSTSFHREKTMGEGTRFADVQVVNTCPSQPLSSVVDVETNI